MAANIVGQVKIIGSIGSDGLVKTISSTGDVETRLSTSLPAAIAGTLTTRTNDTQGVITTTVAHGLAGTETIAVFWDGGRCYQCTINSFTDTTITFTAAAGDALPSVGSAGTSDDPAVTVAVAQRIEPFAIPGSTMQQLMVGTVNVAETSLCQFFDSGNTSRYVSEPCDTDADIWPMESGETAPFSQTVTYCDCYNGETRTATMYVYALQ